MTPPDHTPLDERPWDALVGGAGPAGGICAALLAARGWRVLLVEKSPWPRAKVCGGCLNAAAVQTLAAAGLAQSVTGARPIERVRWHVGGQSLEIPTPGGVALCRSEFDAALVAEAQTRGCTFLPHATARLLPATEIASDRAVELTSAGNSVTVRAAIVLACDGITGTLLDHEPWARWRIAPNAWIGVSATFPGEWNEPVIQMDVGRGGYVGRVGFSHGRVHLAAALDPIACRTAGGPANLIAAILNHRAGDLANLKLRGSGLLTRRRAQLAANRVLVLGDACGYVEPFTGEGMAWALTCGRLVAQMLIARGGWSEHLPRQWRTQHARLIGRRQRWRRAGRILLHHPRLAQAALIAARLFPSVGTRAASRICRGTGPMQLSLTPGGAP